MAYFDRVGLRSSPYPFLMAVLLVLILAAKIFFISSFGLTDLEAYYFTLSKYSEYGRTVPFIGIIDLVRILLGDSILSLRIIFPVSHFLTSVLIYYLSILLFRERIIAVLSVGLFNIIPLYQELSLFVNLTTFEVLISILYIVNFLKWINRCHMIYLLLSGLILGVGIVIGPLMILNFIAAAMLPFLFVRYRYLLRDRRFYFHFLSAILIASILLSYNFLYLGSFYPLFDLGRFTTFKDIFERLFFHLTLDISSMLGFFVIFALITSLRMSIRGDTEHGIIFLFGSIFIVSGSLIGIFSGDGSDLILSYGYLLGCIPLGCFIYNATLWLTYKETIFLRQVLSLGVFLSGLIISLSYFEIMIGLKEEPVLVESVNQSYGWKDISYLVKTENKIMNLKGEDSFVISDSFGVCSKLRYYLDERIDIFCVDKRRFDPFSLDLKNLISRSAIIVTNNGRKFQLPEGYNFKSGIIDLAGIPINDNKLQRDFIRLYTGYNFEAKIR